MNSTGSPLSLPPQSRWTHRLLEVGFLVMAAVLAMHQIYDPDFWYHLAAGDHMVKTGAILRRNFFSYTYPDYPWSDVYWMYEVSLHWLWDWGQAAAVVGFKVAVNAALAGLLLWGLRKHRRPLGTVEATLLMVGWLLVMPRLTDRPELISFLLLAAILTLLRRGHGWWCVLVQALWANVHGFFVLGPALAAGWAISEGLLRRWRTAKRAAAVALACVGVSALSPFGWKNLLTPQLIFASGTRFNWQIEESVSPFHPWVRKTDGSWLLLIVFLIMATLLLAYRWRRMSPFDWMATLATLPLALTVRRFVPLFILCSLPGLLQCGEAAPEPRTRRLRIALLGLMLAFASDFAFGPHSSLRYGRTFGWGVDRKWLPEAAAAFVRQRMEADARLLNVPFRVGDYLIWAWQGRPGVFVDGRTEAYPAEFWRDALAMTDDQAVFARLVKQFRVSHLFIGLDNGEGRAFAQRIAADGAWRQIYADRCTVIFERIKDRDD